ncbi:MAG: branched-chain amino acid transport system ATP-binding protein [Alphaproteobacteria bacterium]|jgi:branched-chain amino acid transport system ATP-binding protein|nr:branched-chain amino acid transport system ATP-binding protein [Alphaproteobacteria bacterium]MEA3026457.1 branched-chain amino acid transport system ATP-binding protein [Alphaproteobacteria bacterium]
MRSAPSGVAVLSVEGASKRFGGLIAVDSMSFDLAENEVLGLIGPNGSGKTTMLNLISGALKPSGGAIRLYGDDISAYPANEIAARGVARTFQIVRMLPSLTVLENVAAGGVFGHSRRWGRELDDQARGLLRRVGLQGADHAPVATLTYIDQKRVELARALASEPKVVLLDEWLAGLNPTELRTGIALIEQIRTEGRAIIIVEHVMDAIRSLCDRCVVMNSGVKIAEGTPKSVLADAEVIRAYLGDADA